MSYENRGRKDEEPEAVNHISPQEVLIVAALLLVTVSAFFCGSQEQEQQPESVYTEDGR